MCRAAERILGAQGGQERRIVSIAFDVDDFNDPWKDAFPDPLYGRRRMAYN
jgi:hypothetical protein